MPWESCPDNGNAPWCYSFSDRWPASLVNSKARSLYYTANGGMVIAPTVQLYCAYPEDGNSMAKTCRPLGGDGVTCIPGCSPNGQQCQQIGRNYGCSFPPTELKAALEAQEGRQDFLNRNNEMVINYETLSHGLPDVIEAFFTPPIAKEAPNRMFAEQARAMFLADFGLDEDDGPPLLFVDLKNGGSAPFSVIVE